MLNFSWTLDREAKVYLFENARIQKNRGAKWPKRQKSNFILKNMG
jgi:hypothetical protein